MKNKQTNLIMIAATAVILVAVNLGVWIAANKGAIVAIDNMLLWSAFVALNVVSILWAVSLLGLQPLVVAISYVAGGFLAFMGVKGMGGISVAEVTTAGATYGAFGALAIGNATTKVRLAFFNKGQVPFIFIIVGLLVIDALLNSGISSAGGSVLLNAVLLPFIIAGVIVGLIWTALNRFVIGQHGEEVETVADESAESKGAEAVSDKLVIQMPEHAAMAEEAEPEVAAVEPKEAAIANLDAVAEAPAETVNVAESASVEEPKVEENFIPLEIDKDDDFVLPKDESSLVELAARVDEPAAEEYGMSSFDESLYESGASAETADAVAVKESEAAPEPVQNNVASEPQSVPEAQEEKGDNLDWLNGHMDLLNKLK